MNKALKISISIFLIIISKSILDIALVSSFFEQINSDNLYHIILYTSLAGIVVIHSYNILQRLYPFLVSILFVFYILAMQYVFYFGHPAFLNKDITLYTAPGFIIIGNILLFMLIKGMTLRISDENFNATDRVVNLSKYAGLIVGAGIIAFSVLYLNALNITTYYSISLLFLFLGFYFFIDLIVYTQNGNSIIDNQQVVRAKNKIHKLLSSPFFIVLFITACAIAISFTLSFHLFTSHTVKSYYEFKPLIRVFGFYTMFMAFLGILFELFLRQKMILYLGIKNVIRMLPIFISLVAVVFILNNHTYLFANEDWKFIFLVVSVFFMLFSQFALENITLPTTFTFYLPIDVEIRHDFYTKSFMFGIFGGIALAGLIIYKALVLLPFDMVITLPFVIIIAALFLFYLNSSPVYKNYRIKLQDFLDIQSRKISINLGLFKDIKNNNPDDFEGIQFVRYLNLLYLTNPTLARQAIKKTINSENNLIQRVSLIKANDIYILDTIEDLFAIKKTKYFPSSPNRDKIDSLINRFEEVRYRMDQERYVDQLSISKKDDERVFGAKLSYYTNGQEKIKIIGRLLKDANLPVVINAIISGQGTDKIKLIKSITDKLDSPALGNAAYSTLLSCGTIILPILEQSYYETGQTEKVQLRIIQLYGDIANEEATEYLIKKLNIPNQNINAATLSALSKCSLSLSEEKTAMLKHELEELCQILVWNMSLLSDINKNFDSKVLKNAMSTEVDSNYESMFDLLSLLYNPKSIKLIRNNLFSNDFEKITFAIELASVLLTDEIKLLVLPLLQPMSIEEKIAFMQDQIPTEKLKRRDVLYTILQRESKWMNQWTKACALAELAKDDDENDLPILLANMINPDPMLAELAARSIIKLKSDVYYANKSIFGNLYTSLFDQSLLERIENSTNHENMFPVLKYEIINFLQEIDEFSNVPGEILKKLTDYILPVEVKAGEVLEEIDNIDVQNYFYILHSGQISLFANDTFIKSFNGKGFISSLDLLPEGRITFSLVSEKDSVLYRMSSYGFIELLTIFDSIPETIVRKTDNKKLKEYEEFIKRRRALNARKKSESILISDTTD